MTPSKFDEIVKKRAAQRVEEKIRSFEKAIVDAFARLDLSLRPTQGTRWKAQHQPTAHKQVSAIFRRLLDLTAEEGKSTGYPQLLWEHEEKAVQTELLATMDEMAKALMAKDVEDPSPQADASPQP